MRRGRGSRSFRRPMVTAMRTRSDRGRKPLGMTVSTVRARRVRSSRSLLLGHSCPPFQLRAADHRAATSPPAPRSACSSAAWRRDGARRRRSCCRTTIDCDQRDRRRVGRRRRRHRVARRGVPPDVDVRATGSRRTCCSRRASAAVCGHRARALRRCVSARARRRGDRRRSHSRGSRGRSGSRRGSTPTRRAAMDGSSRSTRCCALNGVAPAPRRVGRAAGCVPADESRAGRAVRASRVVVPARCCALRCSAARLLLLPATGTAARRSTNQIDTPANAASIAYASTFFHRGQL